MLLFTFQLVKASGIDLSLAAQMIICVCRPYPCCICLNVMAVDTEFLIV